MSTGYAVAKVISDLDKLARSGSPNDPRTPAMRAAAETLRKLAPRQSAANPLDDPERMAVGYRTEIDPYSKQARIVFFRERAQQGVIGYMILESFEVYDLATALMKDYDELEGIE